MEQLKWLTIYFLPILLLTLFAFLGNVNKVTSQFVGWKINIKSFDEPLLNISFDYFLYAPLVAITAFIFVLGSHVGNYLSYTYEMVVSTFLIWFFTTYDTKKQFTVFASMLIAANLFAWQYATLNPKMLGIQDSFVWEKLYKSINPSRKILNSPVFTSRAVELGIPVIDSGRTIYFYTMKPFPANPLFGPSYEEYLRTGEDYTQTINTSIMNKEYDMIYITKDMDIFYDLNLVQTNYEMTDQFIVYMDATNQKWVIQLWEPR